MIPCTLRLLHLLTTHVVSCYNPNTTTYIVKPWSLDMFRKMTGTFLIGLILIPHPISASPTLTSWSQADPESRRAALQLARRAFDTYAKQRQIVAPESTLGPLFSLRSGVFISTMLHGAPRSCMGSLYPMQADLAHEIVACAVASAGQDRRFQSVKSSELQSLRLIVSLVDRPVPIAFSAVQSLDPVHNGLAMRSGDRYGVVLSGETSHLDRMIAWARTRAGAGPADTVSYYRIDDIRLIEASPEDPGPQTSAE